MCGLGKDAAGNQVRRVSLELNFGVARELLVKARGRSCRDQSRDCLGETVPSLRITPELGKLGLPVRLRRPWRGRRHSSWPRTS
jgi:hypothetical protein